MAMRQDDRKDIVCETAGFLDGQDVFKPIIRPAQRRI